MNGFNIKLIIILFYASNPPIISYKYNLNESIIGKLKCLMII